MVSASHVPGSTQDTEALARAGSQTSPIRMEEMRAEAAATLGAQGDSEKHKPEQASSSAGSTFDFDTSPTQQQPEAGAVAAAAPAEASSAAAAGSGSARRPSRAATR